MKLPVEITPSPVVISTVEIRIFSDRTTQVLLPLMLSRFLGNLPILEENPIPKNIREKNPLLKYQTAYKLRNNDYSFSFSDNALSFENVSNYHLWENYFPFIQNMLKELFQMNFITKVERIGVRFASVLNVEKFSIDKIFVSVPRLEKLSLVETLAAYHTNIKVDDSNLFLQMMNNVSLKKDDKIYHGACVDIDASYIPNTSSYEDVINRVDKLHLLQKKLFFDLVSQEYINTLNPRY